MVTKGYGFTVDDIDWSSPADLEPYAKAHNTEIAEHDSIIHAWCGNYILSAVSVAIEHCLAGRKAKSKYIEEPILHNIGDSTKESVPMTEEEKKQQTEQLFMKLRIMGANFNMNHKDGTVS